MYHGFSKDLISRSMKLALPVAGAYLVIVLGLLAEFLIVGNHLGGKGIAAVGLAGTFSLVLVLSFHALEIAAQAIIARRYGEGNFKQAGACLDNALLLSFLLGIPLTILLYFIAPLIFGSKGADNLGPMAVEYFNHRLPSIPFVIAILVQIGFFNAISRPAIPAAVYAVVLILNAFLCYCLVGGHLGFPEMGIAGAGLSQTISVLVGFVGFIMVLLRRHFREKFGVFHFKQHLSKKVMGSLLRLAGPVFVQQFFGNFGMFLFILIVRHVPDGGVSLSAATIARQVGYLTYLPSLGFGIAAATMVGQQLGAGQPQKAAASGYVCWVMGALFMSIGGLCYILFGEALVDLFMAKGNTGGGLEDGALNYNKVMEVAIPLLVIIGIYQPLEAVNTIVGKALQGAGDTMFVMFVSVGCQWFVFLPLAWFLALPMELGAFGAIYAMAIQLSLISLVLIFKYKSGKWQHAKI